MIIRMSVSFKMAECRPADESITSIIESITMYCEKLRWPGPNSPCPLHETFLIFML